MPSLLLLCLPDPYCLSSARAAAIIGMLGPPQRLGVFVTVSSAQGEEEHASGRRHSFTGVCAVSAVV